MQPNQHHELVWSFAHRIVRTSCFFVIFVYSIAWGVLAIANFPIIVVADSDLGLSQRNRSEWDALVSIASLLVLLSSRHVLKGIAPRVTCILVSIAVFSTVLIRDVCDRASPLYFEIAIVGILLASEVLTNRRSHSGSAEMRWELLTLIIFPCSLCGVLAHMKAEFFLCCTGTETSIQVARWHHSVSMGESSLVGDASPLGGVLVEYLRNQRQSLMLSRLSKSGNKMAIACNNRLGGESAVVIWEVDNESQESTEVASFSFGSQWTYSVDFAPDESSIAVSNGDGSVCVTNLITHKQVGEVRGGASESGGYAHSVVFSPDGKMLASWGYGVLRIWDSAKMELIREFATDGLLPGVIAFTPDCTKIVAIERTLRPNKARVITGVCRPRRARSAIICVIFGLYTIYVGSNGLLVRSALPLPVQDSNQKPTG